MKALFELSIKSKTQGRLTSKVKITEQLPREFASKLDAGFEQLPSLSGIWLQWRPSNDQWQKPLHFWCLLPSTEKLCCSLKGCFLLRCFEKPFYKKSVWDAVLKIVQSELWAVKIKAIKNNPKKENRVNRHDKRSSVDVNYLSQLYRKTGFWKDHQD